MRIEVGPRKCVVLLRVVHVCLEENLHLRRQPGPLTFANRSEIQNGIAVMNEKDLKKRTKDFALRVMRLVDALPNTRSGRAIGNQLIRSGTSVGANYRAACRGRSKAEFAAKLGIVEEETDECCYWLELIIESKMIDKDKVQSLLDEANQITALIVASIRTARANLKSAIPNPK